MNCINVSDTDAISGFKFLYRLSILFTLQSCQDIHIFISIVMDPNAGFLFFVALSNTLRETLLHMVTMVNSGEQLSLKIYEVLHTPLGNLGSTQLIFSIVLTILHFK